MRFTRRHPRPSGRRKKDRLPRRRRGSHRCLGGVGVGGAEQGPGIRPRAGVGGAIRTRAAVRDVSQFCVVKLLVLSLSVRDEVRQPDPSVQRWRASRQGSPAQERHRERGDPDVPLETQGPGALHAEEPEAVQAGGDPIRDRLHLRAAVRLGHTPVRQLRGRPGQRCGPHEAGHPPADLRAPVVAQTAPGSPSAQHHPRRTHLLLARTRLNGKFHAFPH